MAAMFKGTIFFPEVVTQLFATLPVTGIVLKDGFIHASQVALHGREAIVYMNNEGGMDVEPDIGTYWEVVVDRDHIILHRDFVQLSPDNISAALEDIPLDENKLLLERFLHFPARTPYHEVWAWIAEMKQ